MTVKWKHIDIGNSKIFMDYGNIVLIQADGIQVTIDNEEFKRIITEFQEYHRTITKEE